MSKSQKRRKSEDEARKDKRALRQMVIVVGSLVVAFGLSVVATGALINAQPTPPSDESSAVTIPDYDHTRVDRIGAKLANKPVAVHPMMRAVMSATEQQALTEKIKQLDKPIDVVVTPENDYDESRADMDLLARRIASTTGESGVVIVATATDTYVATNNVALTSASFIESEAKGAAGSSAPMPRVLSGMVSLIAQKEWMQGPPADASTSSDAADDEDESRAMLAGFPVSGYVFGWFLGLLAGGVLLTIAIVIENSATGGARAKAVSTSDKGAGQ